MVLVELMLRLPMKHQLSLYNKYTRRSLWTLKAKNVSDRWREKAMSVYAARTFGLTCRIFIFILAILIVSVVCSFVVDIVHDGYLDFVFSTIGIFTISFFGAIYFIVRSRILKG